VDYINAQLNTHIITLEQPIEFRFSNKKALLDQREVGKDTESFLTGLRYALRQDPDIVMVGEMRDIETISTAITTAETGHLVLSTLHTSSAVGTINRIVNSFPPHQRGEIRTQISLSIQGVISQILVPNAERTTLVPVFEVLYPTYGIRNLIRTDKIDQIESIMQTDKNCTTIRKEILKMIHDGIVTEEDARKFIHLDD
ncbi:Flp pilus assembly complex ATPase component TadA, partial [bacterium]|nr:Flp pilus assembly complex ATPase component TadA [bacterium]